MLDVSISLIKSLLKQAGLPDFPLDNDGYLDTELLFDTSERK